MTEHQRGGLGPWRAGAGVGGFPAGAVVETVGERFAAVAAQHADAVALRSPAAVWTYADLSGEVSRMAGGIERLVGPRTGQPVAVLAEHDGPLVAAVLAVISAGHVVVILDPAAPPEQTLAVLAEACPRHLLHDRTHGDAAAELAAAEGRLRPVSLDDLHGEFAGPEPLGWHAPMMLAFTSGTSG
ncbi:MAG: AMP-binding protein, partial [Microthrixaceae bacterium]